MAVGTHKGYVQIWDAAAGKKLSVLEGHTARVGELKSRMAGGETYHNLHSLLAVVYYQLLSLVSGESSSFLSPFLLYCQVRWPGMQISCRPGAVIE